MLQTAVGIYSSPAIKIDHFKEHDEFIMLSKVIPAMGRTNAPSKVEKGVQASVKYTAISVGVLPTACFRISFNQLKTVAAYFILCGRILCAGCNSKR